MIARGPDDFSTSDADKTYGRTYKRLPIDEQNAIVYLAGNKIYMFSFATQVGAVIEDQAICSLLTAAFDDHWEKTKS
jgi:hypothetical protein